MTVERWPEPADLRAGAQRPARRQDPQMNANSRFDPFKVLQSDWRKRAWERWLLRTHAESPERSQDDPNKAACAAPSVAPPTESGVSAAILPTIPPPAIATPNGNSVGAAATAAPAMAPAGATMPTESDGSDLLMPTIPPPAMPSKALPNSREMEGRRNEWRARFDELFDRISALEDALDTLSKRFALNVVHERRQEQRLFERIENSAELLERQTLAIEAVEASIERIEQRIERRLRLAARGHEVVAPEPTAVLRGHDAGELAEFEDAFGEETEHIRHRSVLPAAAEGVAASGSAIHGNLAEMSLATVLAMLEIERRTGLLRICADDGKVVTATLSAGSIVGARRGEVEADPVEVVREAMRFRNGHFWFRQAGVEVASGPPRSVGSVLLEASSRDDEAARAS